MNINNLKYENIIGFLPPKSYINILHSNEYCYNNVKNKNYRRIFRNNKYNQFEIEYLILLKNKIKLLEKTKILPDFLLLKLLYNSGFKINIAIERFKKYYDFLDNEINYKINSEVIDIFKLGIFFLYGFDKKFRPIIYLNADKMNRNKSKILEINQALIIYFNIIKKYTFKDYHIENFIQIIDLEFLGISEFPFKIFKKCIVENSLYMAGCMHKTFILNFSFMFNLSWKLIKKFLDETVILKFEFYNKEDFHKLLEHIDKDMLLNKYGGSLDEPKTLWPVEDLFILDKNYNIPDIDYDNRIDKTKILSPYYKLKNINVDSEILEFNNFLIKEKRIKINTKKILINNSFFRNLKKIL